MNITQKAIPQAVKRKVLTFREKIHRTLSSIQRNTETKNCYFSQGGEDYILDLIFRNTKNGRYVDVGTHHPISLNNTWNLYTKGWSGICVEVDPHLCKLIQAVRPRDRLYQIAASNVEGQATFYLGKHSVHNSLHYSSENHANSIQVEVDTLKNLLDKNNFNTNFEVLSIDVEGHEIPVLDGLNLSIYRPRIIVVEFNTAGQINTDLQPFLIENGYQILFVTPWNFVATSHFEIDSKILVSLTKSKN